MCYIYLRLLFGIACLAYHTAIKFALYQLLYPEFIVNSFDIKRAAATFVQFVAHSMAFKATLESIFRRLNWENKGVKIDGELLSNLRFADDIFLRTETPQELQHMLHELSDESRRMGLKMNIAKTKVMVVDNTPINVNNVLIEHVPGYLYLGLQYSIKEKNQDKEIRGRLGGIRQTPGYLQKQPCHLPEEICVQLLCAASFDIWCRDLDTDQTSTEQTCGRKYQNGKKYAQHHIQR